MSANAEAPRKPIYLVKFILTEEEYSQLDAMLVYAETQKVPTWLAPLAKRLRHDTSAAEKL